VRSEGFYVNEKSLTPAGIKPATFRFVAQHLNHCATAVPKLPSSYSKYKYKMLKSANVFFLFVLQETGHSLIHPTNNCGMTHGGTYFMAQMLIWLL